MSGKPEKELRLPVQREQLHVPEIEGELASLKIIIQKREIIKDLLSNESKLVLEEAAEYLKSIDPLAGNVARKIAFFKAALHCKKQE